MAAPLYREYVAAQSRRSPCLTNLSNFLFSSDGNHNYPSRIYSLEYKAGCTQRQIAEVTDLHNLLTRHGAENERIQGRTLVIEDPTREIVETLGSSLDIDPFFFASHIGSPFEDISQQSPVLAVPPSRLWTRSFISIDYHRLLNFSKSFSAKTLLLEGNIPRKLKILPSVNGSRIGLARSCISVLRKCVAGRPWLCLVLVDAPIRSAWVVSRKSRMLRNDTVMLEAAPFQGGTEEFTDPPLYSKYLENPSDLRKTSLFDDLVYHMQDFHPGFDARNPSLLYLAEYPLKVVTSEWIKYTSLMQHCVKQYEYSVQDVHLRLQDNEILDGDLHCLQSWRRRASQSLQKLRTLTEFTRYWSTKEKSSGVEAWDLMIRDFEYIAVKIEAYSRQLEAVLPIVMSLVQILESRRSSAEAANIKQLTFVALIFVPLTYVATLFSMSDKYAPSNSAFWVYFVVAVPLSMLVLAVARVPVSDLKKAWSFTPAELSRMMKATLMLSDRNRKLSNLAV